MEPHTIISAKEIEADWKAMEAFRRANPSSFDGSNPDRITAWISEMNGLFVSYHVSERIFAVLAIMQLSGEALEW